MKHAIFVECFAKKRYLFKMDLKMVLCVFWGFSFLFGMVYGLVYFWLYQFGLKKMLRSDGSICPKTSIFFLIFRFGMMLSAFVYVLVMFKLSFPLALVGVLSAFVATIFWMEMR